MSTVSVIVPCYNEQDTIGLLLDALYGQTYPCEDMEVVIADGQSTDRTRENIDNFRETHPGMTIRVVINQKRTIPTGLNQALEVSMGDYIVRLDAHSVPSSDYVECCVKALNQGRGDNVGGVWNIHPGGDGWLARSIAVAASHPIGVGDARYRLGGEAQAVDTVPFGAYRRSLVETIGPYDETLLTNEDYEFNVRIRQSGGVVWFDPSIQSVYYARANLKDLARQYWRYGYWKARMLRRYPHTLRWRQLLPPTFVLAVLIFLLISMVVPIAGWLFGFLLTVYYLTLLTAGIFISIREKDVVYILGLPLAIATMHFSWGIAFLWSFITPPKMR
ncbi:MAG: glycosyltransferase family 2 protein [Anaerolineales bacterium]|jgi:glycosyltransferase involved in cell wall biosynthesis